MDSIHYSLNFSNHLECALEPKAVFEPSFGRHCMCGDVVDGAIKQIISSTIKYGKHVFDSVAVFD